MSGKRGWRVYKYALPAHLDTRVKLPLRAEILTVEQQDNLIVLYARVPDAMEQETETRIFNVIPTGAMVDADDVYIGTVMLYAGTIVAHVFEVKENKDAESGT